MSSLHTKTKFISGDEVVVIAGKDLGKRGTLQKILKGNKAIVTGLNLVKKHTKPNPQMGITGGIVEQEAAIAISNLAIWNSNGCFLFDNTCLLYTSPSPRD